MRKIERTYYQVHYAEGSCQDCATCETLKDAEVRQEEIKTNQIAQGYKPDETHIYMHVWSREIDEERNIIVSDSKTVTFVK